LPFSKPELFPHGFPVAADGFGNFWVADLSAASTAIGPIYYACHDPPIVAYQSATLGQFLEDLFKLNLPPHESPIDDVHERESVEIWKRGPGVLGLEAARASADPVLASFARGLPEGFSVSDLRAAKIGDGFAWGRFGPETRIVRHGTLPVWGFGK
jgi:hypothetical protein